MILLDPIFINPVFIIIPTKLRDTTSSPNFVPDGFNAFLVQILLSEWYTDIN